MKFCYTSKDWSTIEEGEKNCFLMGNGLGGFCSLTTIGSVARGDQALLMSAKKAPNVRMHLLTNLLEICLVDNQEYCLTSQRLENEEQNTDMWKGYRYLKSFSFEYFPEWIYQIEDITITKKICMVYLENTVGVLYEIHNPSGKKVQLKISPMLRCTMKNDAFDINQNYQVKYQEKKITIENKKEKTDIYVISEQEPSLHPVSIQRPFYFSQDERDGRIKEGSVLLSPEFVFETKSENGKVEIGFSTKQHRYEAGCIENFFAEELHRKQELIKKASLKSDLANTLLLAADAYLVNRDSIQGKSIIAGYPFFEDWGRDTMISLPGITLKTKRFEECKQILRTFAKYEKHGLLPNLFPEGDVNPMYNSVDAPLLFINTVYEYWQEAQDVDFAIELLPTMQNIMTAYENGTDFHIKMDEDGLIQAGADLEQLTWMDVRVGDFLPTPRHGKPVEINAYWYSACKIMELLYEKIGEDKKQKYYADLAAKVKNSFLDKFWNEEEDCLKDVLSGDTQENQIRPNQVWALTMPFTMLSFEQEEMVLKKIREELYTTVGLRTLSPKDPAFHEIYIGPMEERDRAYHQGTVWTFPLGAYYRACVKVLKRNPENRELKQHLEEGKKALEHWLREGCVGQLAEIYDGLNPTISRGCFAQAWSVGEILRFVD